MFIMLKYIILQFAQKIKKNFCYNYDVKIMVICVIIKYTTFGGW